MKAYSMIIFFFIFLPLFFSEKPRLGLVNQSRGFFMSSLGVYEPALSVKSYYFSIKWLTPFYPAKDSQAAGGGEKCMDLRFLRLRRWLLKQQPNKTVFNRFIEN